MPRYEDTETQVLGQLPVSDHLRDTLDRLMEEAALARAAERVQAQPVPYEELETRPHIPRDWRDAVARVPGESEPATPVAPLPPPPPRHEPFERPTLTPPDPPPGYVAPKLSWTDAVAEALRSGVEEVTSRLPNIPSWSEATSPLRRLRAVTVDQRINPIDSLRMRVGGALGWWPTLSELEQDVQTQAGISIPAQQWLKENTNYYQAEPGEPRLDYPFGGVHLPAGEGPLEDALLLATFGDATRPAVTTAGANPLTYAHEALHARFDATMQDDPERLTEFISRAHEVSAMDPLTLPTRQRPAWEAVQLWRRMVGRDPYWGSATELHSYLGQAAWKEGLDAIPEPLREFYFDFYAAG